MWVGYNDNDDDGDGVLTLVHFTDVLPVYGHKTGCKKMHLDGRNKQVVVRYNSVLGSIMPARKGDGTNELRHTMIPYHLLPNRHQEHIHSIVCRLGKKEKERIKEKRQEGTEKRKKREKGTK